MASKTLNAFVVISGRVDNSFGRIGTALVNMGATVDEFSQKLINFGKESVEVYRGYQDSMLDARVALSTIYGKDTKELEGVMKTLDKQATEWAASTIFHTDDVANAIAGAAHAGWDLNKILDGIPAAMMLAQAGGMGLSDSVDYIIKSVNGAGIEFKDITQFVDEWTFAANRSAGNVQSFGDSMLRMGSTMRFARNKEELLTLIAVTHDAGTEGAEAGTLIRNSIMRIVAPTNKAAEAFDELGVSSDEAAELINDAALAEANAELAAHGFTAFDHQGKMKPVLEIYQDLRRCLGEIAGGYENIASDEDSLRILGAIFTTRSITQAITMMNAAANGYNGLYDALERGDAIGYGKYASETMMSGLGGSMETFASKAERLKQLVGGNLSGQVSSIADSMGVIIDKVAAAGGDNGVSAGLDNIDRLAGALANTAEGMDDLDPAMFDALCSGLGTIAVTGPGLIAAGSAFRFLGFALGTNAGRIALAALGISAVTEAVKKYNEVEFKDKFGSMDFDTTELDQYLSGIRESFEQATAPIESYRDALNGSVTAYNNASQTLSSMMLSDMLTQKPLTEKDLEQYLNLGNQMISAVEEGITASADMSAEFWMALFTKAGNTEDELADNSIFEGIRKALNDGKEESLAEVEGIGAELRAALTQAFENDGVLDEIEYGKIKDYYEKLNEAMVRAQREARDKQDYINRKTLMGKAQNLSYDAMMDFISNDVVTQRQAELDYWTEEYQGQRYSLEYDYEKALEEAKTDEERRAADEKYIPLLSGADATLQSAQAAVYADYDDMILDLMETVLHESDLAGADKYWSGLTADVQSGLIPPEIAQEFLNDSEYSQSGFMQESDAKGIHTYYNGMLQMLGGYDEVVRRIDEYTRNGDAETAERLQTLVDKVDYLDYERNWEENGSFGQMTPGEMLVAMNSAAERGDADLLNYFETIATTDNTSEVEAIWNKMSNDERVMAIDMANALGKRFDFEKVNANEQAFMAMPGNIYADEYAAWKLMNMSAAETNAYRYESAPAPTQASEPEPIQPEISTDTGDTKNLITQELSPVEIDANFGSALSSAASARSSIESTFSAPITQVVNVVTNGMPTFGTSGGRGSPTKMMKMAKGGRETRPAIFAEAGIPEWYIPEEHTDNTANLILSAARASGFDIFDLAERAGAMLFAEGGVSDGSYRGPSLTWATLNTSGTSGSSSSGGSDGEGSGITVQYSPVIHADNAQGVERALMEDKKRLQRWFEEWWEKRKLYESMVTYQ